MTEEKPEKQEYIERYCNLCKKDRIFITSLSPTGILVCSVCLYRESVTPTKMIKDDFGYRMIKGEEKSK